MPTKDDTLTIVKYLSLGFTAKEIASKMKSRENKPYSPRTIESYISILLKTHGCDNAAHYRDWETDRKSTRLNSSHITRSRIPSSA